MFVHSIRVNDSSGISKDWKKMAKPFVKWSWQISIPTRKKTLTKYNFKDVRVQIIDHFENIIFWLQKHISMGLVINKRRLWVNPLHSLNRKHSADWIHGSFRRCLSSRFSIFFSLLMKIFRFHFEIGPESQCQRMWNSTNDSTSIDLRACRDISRAHKHKQSSRRACQWIDETADYKSSSKWQF